MVSIRSRTSCTEPTRPGATSAARAILLDRRGQELAQQFELRARRSLGPAVGHCFVRQLQAARCTRRSRESTAAASASPCLATRGFAARSADPRAPVRPSDRHAARVAAADRGTGPALRAISRSRGEWPAAGATNRISPTRAASAPLFLLLQLVLPGRQFFLPASLSLHLIQPRRDLLIQRLQVADILHRILQLPLAQRSPTPVRPRLPLASDLPSNL